MQGGEGDDTIYGGHDDAADELWGGPGPNVATPGLGADTVRGVRTRIG
jgi:Ca2+-binding RTX toxin-like protein